VEKLLRRMRYWEQQIQRVGEFPSRCESVRGEEGAKVEESGVIGKKGQFPQLTSRKEGYRLTLSYNDTIHRFKSNRTNESKHSTIDSSPTRLNQFSKLSHSRSRVRLAESVTV